MVLWVILFTCIFFFSIFQVSNRNTFGGARNIKTSKEKSSLPRQYKTGRFWVQKIESYGSTGFQEVGFLAYFAQGDQEGPLGGRLLG